MMIEISDAHIKIEEKLLFTCENFSLEKEQMVALLGKNGTGKSTFLSAICRLNNHISGVCTLNGTSIFELNQKEILKQIAIVPVKQLVFGKIRLIDLVLSGKMAERNFLDIVTESDFKIAKTIIKTLGIGDFEEQLFSHLSDGEQKLGLIAKALFQEADCLFLDEPEAFLDVGNRSKVFETLHSLANQGKAIFFSTHQPNLAKKYCTHIAYISNQKLKIVEAEAYDETLQNEIFYQ